MHMILWHLLLIKLLTLSYESPVSSKPKKTPFASRYMNRKWGSKSRLSEELSKTNEDFIPNSQETKLDQRRGLDINVLVASTTPREDSGFLDEFENDLIREMDKTLKGMNLSKEAFEDEQLCRNCEEMVASGQLKRLETFVKPASHCDHWDAKTRTCWFERNIGDTLTFVLATNNLDTMTAKVTWKKEFYVKHSSNRKEFVIEPANSMWNIAIGRRDMELRLSPITETDVDFNRFSATVQEEGAALLQTSNNKVNFQIQVVPIDLGFVYLGETLELNMLRFCGLPHEGISYQWLLESDSDYSTLPSNVKINPSGSSVTISELRKDQEGVIACAAYTGFGAFVAKRRFLIRDISENNDISLAVLNLKKQKDFAPAHRHSKLKRALIRRSPKEIEELEEEFENQFDNVKRAVPPSSLENGDKENSNYPVTSKRGNQQGPNPNRGYYNKTPNESPNRGFPERRFDDGQRFPERNVEELSQPRLMSPRVLDSNQTSQVTADVGNLDGQEGLKYTYPRQSALPGQDSEGSIPENIARKPDEYKTENDAQQEQTKDIILDIKRKVFHETQVVDKVRRFMAPCSKDRQCSGHALCIKENDVTGVCHCLPGYRGDGIFCDKEAIVRIG